jgi:hypothetical protein
LLRRTRFLPRGPFLLCHLLFVVALLIGNIPSGEDHHARRQSLLLAPLLGILDVEIDVIRVFGLLLVLALKAVSPRRIVLDQASKLSKNSRLASTRAVSTSARAPRIWSVLEGRTFSIRAGRGYLFECPVQIREFSEQGELHGWSPRAALRFAFDITRRLGVLSLPFPLLSLRKEPHLGRFSLDAPAIFDVLHVAIDLHFVQGLLLVFAVPGFESRRNPAALSAGRCCRNRN